MKPLPLAEAEMPDAATVARAHYAAVPSNWHAELELWFARNAGKTRLMRRRHLGPLVVQKPFHPEKDGTCHVYLLHPPGGVAGGDRLDMRFHLAPAARALLTTPGATKFYRSEHGLSAQFVTLDVGEGAVCEYLPQETILFDGANAPSRPASPFPATRLMSAGSSSAWDVPRPGSASSTAISGRRIEIVRDGRPIWFERMQHAGGSPIAAAALRSGRPADLGNDGLCRSDS